MREEKERGDGEAVAPWDCGSLLYDSFELASLYHLLDRNLMTLHYADVPLRGEVADRADGKEYKKVVFLGGFVEGDMKRKMKIDGGLIKGHKFKKVNSVAFWKTQRVKGVLRFDDVLLD